MRLRSNIIEAILTIIFIILLIQPQSYQIVVLCITFLFLISSITIMNLSQALEQVYLVERELLRANTDQGTFFKANSFSLEKTC